MVELWLKDLIFTLGEIPNGIVESKIAFLVVRESFVVGLWNESSADLEFALISQLPFPLMYVYLGLCQFYLFLFCRSLAFKAIGLAKVVKNNFWKVKIKLLDLVSYILSICNVLILQLTRRGTIVHRWMSTVTNYAFLQMHLRVQMSKPNTFLTRHSNLSLVLEQIVLFTIALVGASATKHLTQFL